MSQRACSSVNDCFLWINADSSSGRLELALVFCRKNDDSMGRDASVLIGLETNHVVVGSLRQNDMANAKIVQLR